MKPNRICLLGLACEPGGMHDKHFCTARFSGSCPELTPRKVPVQRDHDCTAMIEQSLRKMPDLIGRRITILPVFACVDVEKYFRLLHIMARLVDFYIEAGSAGFGWKPGGYFLSQRF